MNCDSNPLAIFAYFLVNSCSDSFGEITRVRALDLSVYLQLLALTLLLEMPLYFVFLRKELRWSAFFTAVFMINLATHPLVCYGFPRVGARLHWTLGTMELMGEIFAPLTEAILLAKIFRVSPMRAVAAAVSANLFSWFSGTWLLNH